LCSPSGFLVSIKCLSNKVFGFVGYICPHWLTHSKFLVFNFPLNLQLVVTFEGRVSGEQDVGDDSGAPDVNLTFIGQAFDYLRCHVNGSAALKILGFARGDFTSEAEICYLNAKYVRIRAIEQDVLKLQITMDDPLAMQVVQALKYLINDIGRLLLIEIIISYKPIKKFAALYEFCYYIDICVVLEKLKHTHNIRVRYFLQGLQLVFHQVFIDWILS
jgi:hypothetical protein